MKHLGLLAIMAGLLVVSAPVFGNTIPISYSSSNIGGSGLPVSVQGTITTSNGVVTVELINEISGPTSVIQNISDFGFVLSSGSLFSLTGVTGAARTIAGDGTFSDVSLTDSTATTWHIDQPTTHGADLSVFGSGQPKYTIIGGPSYPTSGGGSISGNSPHNPFLAPDATFEFTASDVTVDTTLTSFLLSFGTTPGQNEVCAYGAGCTSFTPAVPEPASLVLLGSGLLGLACFCRKR